MEENPRMERREKAVRHGGITGVVNSPKDTANHVKIPNTVSESKEVGNEQIPGAIGSGPKD